MNHEPERCGKTARARVKFVARRRIELNYLHQTYYVFLAEHIDGGACYIDVGFSYPGCAENFDAILSHRLAVGSQGCGCSPIKRDHELGSERCEAVCLISTGDADV